MGTSVIAANLLLPGTLRDVCIAPLSLSFSVRLTPGGCEDHWPIVACRHRQLWVESLHVVRGYKRPIAVIHC